jgi:hypothetical protein
MKHGSLTTRRTLIAVALQLFAVACSEDVPGSNPGDGAGAGASVSVGAGAAGASSGTGGGGAAAPGAWWQPTTDRPLHRHWQLSGDFRVPEDVLPNVTVYDLDGELTSAETVAALHALGPEIIVICYFDAGVFEAYRSDADSFPASVIGSPDLGWEDSYWLDIRQRDVLLPIMHNRMVAWCKDKGFDAIEPDETEVWSNDSGFPITLEENTAYNTAIAEMAHSLGLSVGLKGNNSEAALNEPQFDWALTEECWAYEECDNFKSSFLQQNKAVFSVEYEVDPDCATSNAWRMNSSRRDLQLVGPSSPDYLHQPCVADTQDAWE